YRSPDPDAGSVPAVALCAGDSSAVPIRQGPRIKSARRIGLSADGASRSWTGSGYPACATADSPLKPHQESFPFRTPRGLSHSVPHISEEVFLTLSGE